MQPSPSPPRSWMLWVGGALLLVFAAFIVLQLFSSDNEYLNQDELALLDNSYEQIQAKAGPAKAVAAHDDWPQWRGPQRTGHSAERDLKLDWSSTSPKQLWEQSIGDGYGSIAVADGRVVTGFQADANEVFACFDAKTGDVLWRHDYAARFKDDFGSGPRSTPTIDGDRVFTVGASGVMHCLALDEHKEIWSKNLIEEFAGRQPTWGFSFSPLVWDDRVFVNPGGPGKSLVALERTTGKVLWSDYDIGGGYSSPVASEMFGVKQVVFLTAMGLISVVPESGKELWRFPWTTNYDANIATPIVWGEYVFVSSGYGRGCALIRLARGGDGSFEVHKVYEHRKMCNHFSSCVLHKGFLYGFNESVLTCLDLRDGRGKPRWTERDFGKGSLLVVDDHLVIFGENGRLGVAKADPQSFQETGRIVPFDGPHCWAAPALAQGRLYLRNKHKLVCFDLKN